MASTRPYGLSGCRGTAQPIQERRPHADCPVLGTAGPSPAKGRIHYLANLQLLCGAYNSTQ